MLPTPFLRRLSDTVRPLLAADPQPLHIQARGRLLKLWFGPDESIHYEVWIHDNLQLIELGLHCEADPLRNARIRRQLGFHMFDIKAALGNSVELEEWDRGWVRLYETHPLSPLDEPRLDELARRLATFVTIVQPIYAQLCRVLASDG
ncbi:MAG: hypothetical protein ACR2M0_03525 [Chloroflexia bacterium]